MKRVIVSVLCGVALLVATTPTDVMAAKNPARVRQGVKSKGLKNPEAKKLKVQLKALRAEMKAAKANGKISKDEKARFKAERDRLRNEIKSQTGK